jgi:hypothetical protein
LITLVNNDQQLYVRKIPTLMNDYEVTRINQFDDLFTYFSLFLYYNHVTSKDVVQEIKWQRIRDDEIDVIKKNNTQELMKLLKGQKIIGVK